MTTHIYSLTQPPNITIHTIKRKCREGCGNMCHDLLMAQITICKDKSVNEIIDDYIL
jgi:hypothetical protein